MARLESVAVAGYYPTPPHLVGVIAARIDASAVQRSTYDPQRLSQKLANDAILTGRLISRVNSAAFGLRTPVTSLRQSIVPVNSGLCWSVTPSLSCRWIETSRSLTDSRCVRPSPPMLPCPES